MHTPEPLISSVAVFLKNTKIQKNSKKTKNRGNDIKVRFDYFESNSYKQVSWSPLNTTQPLIESGGFLRLAIETGLLFLVSLLQLVSLPTTTEHC